ncbi:MAG TPA: outer membrane beta-barrel protein [Balneolaceae bacterium]|nr:outer membrane beta-barrel protein [Balneolaceae bacterium]
MSDQGNRKDALERLFQQKAEEYDIPFNEDDWLNLENRLDALDRQNTHRRYRRLVAAVAILAFSILAYFTIENQLQIDKLNSQLSSVQSAQQSESNKTGNKNNKPSLGKNEKLGARNRPNKSVTIHTPADQPKTKSKTSLDTTDKTQNKYKSYSFSEQRLDLATASPGFDSRSATTSAIKPSKNKISSNALAAASHNESIALVNPRDHFGRRNFTRVSLGLVMGPDLSTAGGFSNFYDPGYKLGFTLDYNFNSRLGITTGVIRTRTRYTAGSNDYRLPNGYLAGGIQPENTTADCVLLDIPMSLKYNFSSINHSRLYVTAGISTYIMLNEKYRFDYESYQSGSSQGWSGKTGTTYLLSNATLSVGYEVDLLKNWSLRAEPYLKIPVKRVGWGKVDLYSMGTVVSLNFNLPNH